MQQLQQQGFACVLCKCAILMSATVMLCFEPKCHVMRVLWNPYVHEIIACQW